MRPDPFYFTGMASQDGAVKVGGLLPREVDAVVDLWNRVLPADAVTRDRLEARVLLDPRQDLEDFLVARDADCPVGFLVGVCPRDPLPGPDPAGERAWITMFGVDRAWRRRGVGRALFAAALDRFRRNGRHRVSIATYPYGYHVPGVDQAAYPEAAPFLSAVGFRPTVEAIAMDASLVGYASPPNAAEARDRLAEDGIEIRPYARGDWWSFLRFLAEDQPAAWLEQGRQDLREIAEGQRSPTAITVAADGQTIVGYCRHDAEHFGPFGVAGTHRGRGIGTALIDRMLWQMHCGGLHTAWILWTGDRAARLYGRFGFRETRRFVVYEWEATEDD
jgi:GNAT superfamily N-acetyltransferase